MIYDPSRQRVVMYGGSVQSEWYNDVWELRMPSGGSMTWRQITPQNLPTPRLSSVTVYDPVRDRMLIYGGYSGSPFSYSVTNDVLALNFADSTWSVLATAGTPPSINVQDHGVYDADNDRLVIFGGSAAPETWALSLSGTPTWTQLLSSGSPGGQALLDPVGHRILAFPSATNVWVGSSRVDLQACKLEYSIVSPK